MENNPKNQDASLKFLKFYLWLLFLEAVVLGFLFVKVDVAVLYAFLGLKIFAAFDFCGIINGEMSLIGKKNWRWLSLLLFVPFGFWVVYFGVRKQLAAHGKWKGNIVLAVLAAVINLAIVTFVGLFIAALLNGVRHYARDAKRASDMLQLAAAQENCLSKNGAYLTCSATGGDCGGQLNNYPQMIGDFPTPVDPLNDGNICGNDFTYCGVDNSADNGKDFCYYTKLEEVREDDYYIVSSSGYGYKPYFPAGMEDCLFR
jgi:hypothetical protein